VARVIGGDRSALVPGKSLECRRLARGLGILRGGDGFGEVDDRSAWSE
jgi:hypothetical protein